MRLDLHVFFKEIPERILHKFEKQAEGCQRVKKNPSERQMDRGTDGTS